MPPFCFRFKAPLPLTLNGGLTGWKIQREYFGKGSKNVAIVAVCLDTKEVITLTTGRTRECDHNIGQQSIHLLPDTKAYLIARKRVKDGLAEIVRHEDRLVGGA